MPLDWEYGPAEWEYEDPPYSGQWKAVPPKHQELCTNALKGGSHEVAAHDLDDLEAEWEYDFANQEGKLYRGSRPSFTWPLRRIQRLWPRGQ